jgi:acyl carrier protein
LADGPGSVAYSAGFSEKTQAEAQRFRKIRRLTLASVPACPRIPATVHGTHRLSTAHDLEDTLMTADQIRQVILDILERIAPDEDLSGLDDARPFREQMELDSMDFLDIVMELRKMYRIQIPEEDYPNLNTMAGTVSYLLPRLKDVPVSA